MKLIIVPHILIALGSPTAVNLAQSSRYPAYYHRTTLRWVIEKYCEDAR
jgi:hypothetical protein